MVALLRLFEHFEILVELGLVLEGGAVDALELRVALVALVIRAGHGGELERADVAGTHHVRPGAQINEIAVPEIRNRFVLGNLVEQIELELRRSRPLGQSAQPAALGVLDGLVARDDDLLEGMVGLDFLFHLGLDGCEVLGRDAVGAFEVVVKAGFDGRAVGELGVGPEAEDGGGHHVRARVADALQFGHFRAVIEGLAFVIHKLKRV